MTAAPDQASYAQNWGAAALLALVSSTFSTIASQFAAGRIGRDAFVDWMAVAAIPMRDAALQAEPSSGVIAAGILFHQAADFSWAVVFFGLLGRWTAALRPGTILLVAIPWAVFTSASEWFVLVPLIPFWQPIFPLEQVYWIGLTVHLTSASMYPLFPYLRDRVAGVRPSPNRRFAAAWASLAAAGALALGLLAFLGWQHRELPWVGRDPAYDQAYMRKMAAHHVQGVELARMADQKAADPHLRALARLMIAAQNGDVRIFEQWWGSWFGGALPPASAEEHAGMPGMLSPDEMASARAASGADFDPLFVRLMTAHHQGAIAMANDALEHASDPRLKLMSHGLRHAQSGEIELMHGTEGLAAVSAATRSLLAPSDANGGGAPPHRH